MKQPEVLVIGAGAAGIIAAWRAASLGAKVQLLEKTQRIGTKILVSGGGKCNITHAGTIDEVLRAFRPKEGRFLKSSCYRFPPSAIVEILESRGLKTYAREDGRIFPVDKTAKDVTGILRSILDEAGVEIKFGASVNGLIHENGAVTGVRLNGGGSVLCPLVVLSVGGCTYPNTGSTGDGWPWTAELGHSIVTIRASLAPMELSLPWESPAGLALRGCTLKVRQSGKVVSKWTSDLLFTHRGISGPCALGVSREAAEAMEQGPVTAEVDVFPKLTFEQLTEQLLQFTSSNPRRLISGFLEERMPERAAELLLADAGIDPRQNGTNFEKKARNRLIEAVKGWKVGEITHIPLERGEAAAGGVSLDEVDPHTMRSSKAEGLFLCGEVLDIAGPVGGYNLQAAWATGFAAGDAAGKAARGSRD